MIASGWLLAGFQISVHLVNWWAVATNRGCLLDLGRELLIDIVSSSHAEPGFRLAGFVRQGPAKKRNQPLPFVHGVT